MYVCLILFPLQRCLRIGQKKAILITKLCRDLWLGLVVILACKNSKFEQDRISVALLHQHNLCQISDIVKRHEFTDAKKILLLQLNLCSMNSDRADLDTEFFSSSPYMTLYVCVHRTAWYRLCESYFQWGNLANDQSSTHWSTKCVLLRILENIHTSECLFKIIFIHCSAKMKMRMLSGNLLRGEWLELPLDVPLLSPLR